MRRSAFFLLEALKDICPNTMICVVARKTVEINITGDYARNVGGLTQLNMGETFIKSLFYIHSCCLIQINNISMYYNMHA